MADVFNEVDEQIRSQRYQSMLLRWWPFAAAAAGAALIAALGVWTWNKHQADEDAKASIAYQAGLDAVGKGDIAAAQRQFASVATSGPPTYKSLALMDEAQLSLDQKKPADAVRLFDQAAKAAPDAIIGDAARLKAAWVLMDDHPLTEIEPRLTPLTNVKSPYRSMAREALAMSYLRAGKFDEARGAFAVLALSQDISQAAQARAHAAMDLIKSGSAKMLPAATAAAAALPPEAALAVAQQPVSPSAPQAGAAQ